MPRHSDDKFSEKREEAYRLMVRHIEMYGMQPSVREIAQLLGIQVGAANGRIKGLREVGLLRDPNTSVHSDRKSELVGLRFKAYEVDDETGEPERAKIVTVDGVMCIVIPLPDDHPIRNFDSGISLETGDVPLISTSGDSDIGEAGEVA